MNLDFSATIAEWRRLDAIATNHEPEMRMAFNRAIALRASSGEFIRMPIQHILVDVCKQTAEVHGLQFDYKDPIYAHVVEELVSHYSVAVDARKVREAVSRIIPRNISLMERETILSSAEGMTASTAVSLELARQAAGQDSGALNAITQKRREALLLRSNLVAVTEVNRVVNAALVALWRANEDVSKGENDTVYDNTVPNPAKIPRGARKIWITRRDDRVCNYCDPLDGLTAKLTDDFDTDYGFMPHPPAHPRCRCFMMISKEW